jgi:hypothetical protein
MVFLIRTEKAKNIALVTDIEELHTQTNDVLNDILRDIDDEKWILPCTRALLIDDLIQYKSQLRDFAEMLKVPFDVLVVVGKEE